ncbi:hypothetical protein HUJ04_007089 [Dendroctonus ponderosae]|nr:hypothetical protein HUJ04_007089 [Dendroctonus ponderosae]
MGPFKDVLMESVSREGSEDEIEVTSEADQLDNSIEEPQPYTNNNFQHSKDIMSDIKKLSVKSDLYDNNHKPCLQNGKFNNGFFNQQDESKFDMFYKRTRDIILSSGALPSELELKEDRVYARSNISKGTRYGPFQGKWASIPEHPRFAWEKLQKYVANLTPADTIQLKRQRDELPMHPFHEFDTNV